MVKEQLKVVRVDKGASLATMLEEEEELDKVGAELVKADAVSEDEIIEVAKDAAVVVTGAAQITRRVMENLPNCRAIVRYGVGYDTIDVQAATDNNILVVNVPDFCWEEVSNHAIALVLVCAKKVVLLNKLLKQGNWKECKQKQSPMGSIHGQTLGVVGCGNIGRMTARKAQCFSLKVLGYDPYLSDALAKESGITLVGLPKLLEESDYISVHTPLTEKTYHLIGEKEFKQMKRNAYFINTSRGQVVDEQALIKALEEEWIAGAGLDVFEKEPVELNNPLLKMDNVTVLPHSASYSDASFSLLRRSVGREAARVFSGKQPLNVVNKEVEPKINLKS